VFRDRQDAGRKLAAALEEYKDKGVLVLAVPKGGIEVGYEIACRLNAGFSVIVSRKLPFPDNPESGFGAVAEDGSLYLIEEAEHWLPKETMDGILAAQKKEIRRRVALLRKNEPLPEIKHKTVILVDDGIAMGSTMRASILLCRHKGAGTIIVAAPVAGEDVARDIEKTVDRIVILEKPAFFHAVAQVYENWYDVPDREALEILEKFRTRRDAS
jgi:predicted phosphoribosyltransferase